MARVAITDESIDLDSPTMIEGLPGMGLVGKIAVDHVIDEFDMVHYGNVLCESLPSVAVYSQDQRGISSPVRIYADEGRDLLALQSDVPVSPRAATKFATCVTEWFTDQQVTPIYLSGRPAEKTDEPPSLYGVSAADGDRLLEEADIPEPDEAGLISGPTGALLHHAFTEGITAVGLVVGSDPQFPDPEASRVLIKSGIEPLAEVEVDVQNLVEKAEEIRDAKEQLAKQMQEAEEESTQARPIRGYQ